MDEITTNFEIDSKDSRLTNYVNRLYNGRYREFKAELSSYYKLHKTHEDALANPPIEMLDRGVDQWVELCNHFNSDKFRIFIKSSFANIENRSKKKYNHCTGSRPLSYIVEEMAVGLHLPFTNSKTDHLFKHNKIGKKMKQKEGYDTAARSK
ncbi:uncharacterized protein Fot_14936 [Forsythia ovata]|uniref:Uncharacterized protein n=1 Tax=Forsythia ovata TaxID=205694 RepID=A0ABD1WA98_9LAMI